jgi:alpha-1,6-mannosyltransferase
MKPARIVRLANFVSPRSGGLRTALRELGKGYLAAGHEPVLVIPGEHASDEVTEQGRVITLPGPVIPGLGGYRVLLGRRRVARLLAGLGPDRLEVSDRLTLRWTGGWARANGVPSVMVSHENLGALVEMFVPRWLPRRRVSDRLNAATARAYDQVVCTTAFAAEEFRRLGASNVARVPLGVDLARFAPANHDLALRGELAGPRELLLVHCGRLSAEKRPERSIEALAALRSRAVPAVLAVAGDGPRRAALERLADGLPVRFLGFVPDPNLVARLLATADVALAPGPLETFGLAALEALASGTPVVAAGDGALGEVIGAAGAVVSGEGFAGGVLEVMARPEVDRRRAAREHASRYTWSAATAGMLRVHGLKGAETWRTPVLPS